MKLLMGIFAVVTLCLVTAPRAQAGDFFFSGPVPLETTPVDLSDSDYLVPNYPYSYWASYPSPARGYVGPSAFAYSGHPYGHPYDRWTWSYMDNSRGVLANYYYPPVR